MQGKDLEKQVMQGKDMERQEKGRLDVMRMEPCYVTHAENPDISRIHAGRLASRVCGMWATTTQQIKRQQYDNWGGHRRNRGPHNYGPGTKMMSARCA